MQRKLLSQSCSERRQLNTSRHGVISPLAMRIQNLNGVCNLFCSISSSLSMMQQPNSDPRPLIAEVSRSHTIWHNKISRTALNEWSACRRGHYLHKTQHTNIHVLSGIRTRDPSSRAAADICVRPKDHQDWPFFLTLVINRVWSGPGVVETL
jgi:hypothetical protein